MSPRQAAHCFACTGICSQEGKEGSAVGPEFVIHLAAPARGEFSPLFSELVPETVFADIGLPSQRGRAGGGGGGNYYEMFTMTI